jgi:hypothetical protein
MGLADQFFVSITSSFSYRAGAMTRRRGRGYGTPAPLVETTLTLLVAVVTDVMEPPSVWTSCS